jgi:hypothetical protein
VKYPVLYNQHHHPNHHQIIFIMSLLSRSILTLSMPTVLPIMTYLLLKRGDTITSSITPVQRDSWERDYDYIIVGAGSAGSVLANRLSEDPTVRVLLIEAGGSENIISDIPIAYQSLQQTPMDWAYQTEPQEAACFGLKERVNQIEKNYF